MGIFRLLVGILLCSHSVRALLAADSGRCRQFPVEGLYCSHVFQGALAFEYDGTTFEDVDAEFASNVGTALDLNLEISGATCFQAMQSLACESWFPRCDEETFVPVRPCNSSCQFLHSDAVCGQLFQLAVLYGFSALVPNCNGVIGSSVSNFETLFKQHLADWEGEVMFQQENYFEDAFSDTIGVAALRCSKFEDVQDLNCAGQICISPTVLRWFPILENPGNGDVEFQTPKDFEYCYNIREKEEFDCEKCFSDCVIPCPLPAFTKGEFQTVWVMNWLPGVFSLPLSAYVWYHERKRMNYHQSRGMQGERIGSFLDRFIEIIAACSLLFVLVDSLPSMILREKMRCGAKTDLALYSNLNGSAWCKFGKIKPHILQSLMGAVVCSLFRMRNHLRLAIENKPFKKSKGTKLAAGLCIFGLPVICTIYTFTFESDQLFEASISYRDSQGGERFNFRFFFFANALRFAFTCGPKLQEPWEEWIFVQGPMIIYGMLCAVLSTSLVLIVRDLQKKLLSSANRAMNNQQTKILQNLARTTILFAFSTSFLAALNSVATFLWLPNALDFGEGLNLWVNCVNSGTNQNLLTDDPASIVNATNFDPSQRLSHCGEISEFAPPIAHIYLLTLSQSIVPLTFGVTFASFMSKSRYNAQKSRKRRKIQPGNPMHSNSMQAISALAK